jgi:Cu(I)/Ag(I) efflux system periplasmic protein CusF
MKLLRLLLVTIALTVLSSQIAATSHEASGQLAPGEVRKVDKEGQKLTIRHGPLPEFDMPTPMTMVYRVKDPAMLDQVKAGDKIRFAAEKIDGQFTVTRIEPTK